jgi:hypothetical protein
VSAPREIQSEEFDNNKAQSHPGCGTVKADIFRIRGAHVKKLRKQPVKLPEPTGVPEDFEPQVINETDEGGVTIIVPARPPQETAKTDPPTKTKR